jgi:anti-sigma regulatory factor (Ser/Thr protein kinase)
MHASPLILPLAAEHAAAFVGRQAVGDRFQGLDALDSEDAKLVVSELVTNAVRYGAKPIVLRVEEQPLELRVEVEDANPEMRPPRAGSHGLAIVDRLATQWGVSFCADHKTVWAILPLHDRN